MRTLITVVMTLLVVLVGVDSHEWALGEGGQAGWLGVLFHTGSLVATWLMAFLYRDLQKGDL